MMIFLLVPGGEDNPDMEYLERLYEKYFLSMKRYALTFTREPDKADDLAHDAFIKLIGKVETIKRLPEKAVPSYIIKTTKTVTLNYLTREERRAYYEAAAYELPLEETPELRLLHIEEIQQLSKAVSLLCERDRDLLYFKYVLEMKNREIAKLLAIPLRHISQYLLLARRRALKKLEEMDNEG